MRCGVLKGLLVGTGFAIGIAGPAWANCPSLPNQITNGQVADATHVMADLNALRNCLNNGDLTVPPVAALGLTSSGGTATLQNPAAPSNYNFNLPATAGTTGQVLVSGGGGSTPMYWAAIPGTTAPPLVDGVPVGRPAASLFAWRNAGSATYAEHANGPITLSIPAQSGDQLRGFEQSVPGSPPYTLTVKLDISALNANFYQSGIYIADSSGKLIAFDQYQAGSILQVAYWNSASSFGSNRKTKGIALGSTVWLRINHDGTNLKFSVSRNGADWQLFYSESATAFLSSNISALGVFGDNNDGSATSMNSLISIWSFELASGSGTDSHW